MASPLRFIRAVRTPHSERYLLHRDGQDIACLDIHFPATGIVTAGLLLFEGSGVTEADVPTLLAYIDETLLPEARLDDATLSFHVSIGRVLGAYEAERTPDET
jgi:hypothetical protein